MKPEIPVFMTFAICITYIVKTVVEARLRGKLVAANKPDELVRSMLISDERRRRYSSLRWGVVMICLACGLALVESFGWHDVTPGVIAVLLGTTGVGNIAAYALARKLESQEP